MDQVHTERKPVKADLVALYGVNQPVGVDVGDTLYSGQEWARVARKL